MYIKVTWRNHDMVYNGIGLTAWRWIWTWQTSCDWLWVCSNTSCLLNCISLITSTQLGTLLHTYTCHRSVTVCQTSKGRVSICSRCGRIERAGWTRCLSFSCSSEMQRTLMPWAVHMRCVIVCVCVWGCGGVYVCGCVGVGVCVVVVPWVVHTPWHVIW